MYIRLGHEFLMRYNVLFYRMVAQCIVDGIYDAQCTRAIHGTARVNLSDDAFA